MDNIVKIILVLIGAAAALAFIIFGINKSNKAKKKVGDGFDTVIDGISIDKIEPEGK